MTSEGPSGQEQEHAYEFLEPENGFKRPKPESGDPMDFDYQRIPIIKLWTLLLVPLQGELTDKLANQLTSEVLARIHEEGCSGLVIDITGLWLVDSHLCAVLSELSSAASLMGARTLLSGMKPDIALTLETMGVELKGVRTTLNLEDALSALGVRPPPEDYDYAEATSAGSPVVLEGSSAFVVSMEDRSHGEGKLS